MASVFLAGIVAAFAFAGSAAAATYGGSKDIQPISQGGPFDIAITSGAITITNSSFTVVNSTVGVVQAGPWIITGSTVALGPGASIIGMVKIVDGGGNVAQVDSVGRLQVVQNSPAQFFYAADYGNISAASAGVDNPILLIINPSTTTKKVKMASRIMGGVVINTQYTFRLFKNPVVTSSGTVVPITNIGSSTDTAKAKVYALPTVSSKGSRIDSFPQGQNNNPIMSSDLGQIFINPGSSWLITADPSSNGRAVEVSLKWEEIAE